MTLDNYPGAKTNSGLIQFLINRIPRHNRYYELFAGSAALFFAKKSAGESFVIDKDKEVIAALKRRIPVPDTSSPVNFDTGDALHWILPTYRKCFHFPTYTQDCFIYLDPPYPFSARRSGKKYYRHEMSDADHVKLLTAIRSVSANVMISTRQNELYDRYLHDWRKEAFKTVDRAGAVEEIVYMNYPVPAILHQYDHVGRNFSDRQRIRRKVSRFSKKIEDLPDYEKHLLIQEMIKNDPAAVKHFMTM